MKKHILKSIFLASSLASCAAANAATDINNTSALIFNNNTTSLGATYGLADVSKTFTENFTFNTTGMFGFTGAIISITLGTLSGVNLSAFTLTGNGITSTGSLTSSAGLQTWTLIAPNLSLGNYTLAAVGNVTGTGGGSFGGNVNIAAVPEASTTAMMLGGLALVGFFAARRRKSVNNVGMPGNLMAA
ncbi:FxDxF family PEP-CTERM protein [Herbaspirillum sp. alder98]|uniref:FxDxF family PEP-CTERM protein n=1 Tax=Herbaspirillum sp. alder98 TaxID=2913096 RepID=UPI001CD8CA88|nr:FxDxF family PEP-CTERM protein [Herbaspirillum sp. alder98]MCA1324767.1 FxDxF family PEP-CTERM protein [Herbaspirillum sp. alder98]